MLEEKILAALEKLQTDISGLKTDVSGLKAGQDAMQADISGIKVRRLILIYDFLKWGPKEKEPSD